MAERANSKKNTAQQTRIQGTPWVEQMMFVRMIERAGVLGQTNRPGGRRGVRARGRIPFRSPPALQLELAGVKVRSAACRLRFCRTSSGIIKKKAGAIRSGLCPGDGG